MATFPAPPLFPVPYEGEELAGKGQKSSGSKKPRSEHKKLLAARSFRRARDRHAALSAQQEAAHQHNLRLVKDHELIPWERACLERARRREEEGLYAVWADTYRDLAKSQSELRSQFLAYIA